MVNRPRRGAVVAEASPQRLYEMFEVMAELESVSVRLAARRHNNTDLERIGEAHAACEEALESDDLEMYYQANERFHLAIYAASHNSFLYEETSNMQCRLAVYRHLQLRSHGRLKDSCNKHQKILDATH